jgi:hypothetical protein
MESHDLMSMSTDPRNLILNKLEDDRDRRENSMDNKAIEKLLDYIDFVEQDDERYQILRHDLFKVRRIKVA